MVDSDSGGASDREPVLRVDGPGALLQAVPYLLGFHPERSIVLVGLRERRLIVTVRCDLDDLWRGRLIGHAIGLLVRAGAHDFVAVVYTDAIAEADPLPYAAAIDELRVAASQAGCEVVDALFVGHGRWRSYWCSQRSCCPTSGRPVPVDASPLVAAATAAGMVALPSRAALAEPLEPVPDRAALDRLLAEAENEAFRAALSDGGHRHERDQTAAMFAAARDRDILARVVAAEDARAHHGTLLSDARVASFGVALSALAVRDSMWLAVDDGSIDGRALWAELARRLPSPYDAAPLFLFGWRAWRLGNGALARVAADRATASDPSYRAAALLRMALDDGLDPQRVPTLRRTGPRR